MEVRARVFGVVVALFAALFVATRVQAVPTLDFGIVAPTAGSISYAGGANPLVGSGIEVDNVVGLGTPLNNGVLVTCVGCALNFTTGNFSSSTPTTWEFGAGGTITVVGGVDLIPGGPLEIPAGSTLLSGTFTGNTVVIALGGNFKIAGAVFLDRKHKDLVEFYGLPAGVDYSGGFNISFFATGSPPSGFTSSQVLSGDIVNSPVSIPSSMLLIGSGLMGFVYLHLRHRRS